MNNYSYTSFIKDPHEAALISCVSEYVGLPNTREETIYDLKHFVNYLKHHVDGVHITDITRAHIQAYIDYRINVIREKESTIKRRYYGVNGFFAYLEHVYKSKGFVSPVYKIKLPRIPLPESDRISEEDIEKIRAHILTLSDRNERLTISLMFELAFDIGARPMDLRNVTVAHINFGRGLIVELIRKGNFLQTLAVSQKTIRDIQRYLPIRQRLLKDSGIFRFESLPQEVQDQYPLFPTAYRNKFKDRNKPEEFRVSETTIYTRMVNTAANAGVTMNPMQCRHTFAQKMYDKTKDLLLVQQAMGHTTPAMTTRYATRPADRVQEYLNQRDAA